MVICLNLLFLSIYIKHTLNKKKKILICSEFFYPDIGGAQEIAERIALLNSDYHEVHILTSFHPDRKKLQKKYYIHDFKISGNYVKGIKGEKKKVLSFLNQEFFDQIIFYAAQQWTFDIFLLNDSLLNTKSRFFLIPCGFSKLKFPNYYFYFKKIMKLSKKFENIIFHSNLGNDYKYLHKKLSSSQICIIKNGYKTNKINKKIDINNHYKIDKNSKIIPYIANFNYLKGQIRLLRILNKIKTQKPVSLIFYSKSNFYDKFLYYRLFLFYKKFLFNNKMINIKIHFDAPRIFIENTLKKSSIFLFCSRVEYSPLVIFEAIQYNIPIVSFDVGDLNEVVKKNKFGFVVNNEKDFIIYSNKLLSDNRLFNNIKDNIQKKKYLYNWSNITKKYISIFK